MKSLQWSFGFRFFFFSVHPHQTKKALAKIETKDGSSTQLQIKWPGHCQETPCISVHSCSVAPSNLLASIIGFEPWDNCLVIPKRRQTATYIFWLETTVHLELSVSFFLLLLHIITKYCSLELFFLKQVQLRFFNVYACSFLSFIMRQTEPDFQCFLLQC